MSPAHTLSRLVECVSDRSLVLLDEPETHLHPPLLSSFIRAICDLLYSRNAVAIVATHSPVVLQEVPASCVYRLHGTAGALKAERLDEQTFAENVSHPYFDTLPSFQWLFATLDFSSVGPVLEYRVVLPGGHEAIALRLKHQFDLLKLGKRFRDRSAVVLMEIQAMLSAHAQLLGPEGMAEHFRGEGERMHGLHGNCIESAAYFGAAENEVYCAGQIAN